MLYFRNNRQFIALDGAAAKYRDSEGEHRISPTKGNDNFCICHRQLLSLFSKLPVGSADPEQGLFVFSKQPSSSLGASAALALVCPHASATLRTIYIGFALGQLPHRANLQQDRRAPFGPTRPHSDTSTSRADVAPPCTDILCDRVALVFRAPGNQRLLVGPAAARLCHPSLAVIESPLENRLFLYLEPNNSTPMLPYRQRSRGCGKACCKLRSYKNAALIFSERKFIFHSRVKSRDETMSSSRLNKAAGLLGAAAVSLVRCTVCPLVRRISSPGAMHKRL